MESTNKVVRNLQQTYREIGYEIESLKTELSCLKREIGESRRELEGILNQLELQIKIRKVKGGLKD